MQAKGFTLIELIIVIGIIALLATTVILVINPATIFQEARDSQRIADLGQMSSAMGLYLATASAIDLSVGANTCAANCWLMTGGDTASGCGGRHGTKTASSSSSQVVTGSGWVPVNLGASSGGAPINAWPRDPRNNTTTYYSYACNETAPDNSYEFNANMESERYDGDGDADDVESRDGGNNDNLFEVGNDPGLDL